MRTAVARQPRSVIIDVYGAFVRSMDNWMAIAHLIGLLGQLGIEEQSVRSATARLKKSGLLEGVTLDGVAGYAPTDELLAILADGDERIFQSRRPAALEDGWVVVIFSVPETERDRRHQLRSRLGGLGFGPLSPGAWFGPQRLLSDVRRVLSRLGLDQYAIVFDGAHYDGFDDLDRLVQRAWDFAELRAEYESFVCNYQALAREWAEAPGEDRDAFIDYVSLIDDWRRLAYLDPGLPAELHPEHELRAEAIDLFGEMVSQLRTPASRHVTSVVRG